MRPEEFLKKKSDMTDFESSEKIDRTKFEDDEVLKAPMAWELDMMAQFLADNIKKLPPPGQAAGLAAAQAAIAGIEATLIATVQAMPSIAEEYQPKPLNVEVGTLLEKLRAIPNTGNPERLAEFEEFINRIEHLRGALEGPIPAIPNFLTTALITEQITKMQADLLEKME